MTDLESRASSVGNNSADMLKLSRKIETGFPSPAGDHLEKALSLEELIVRRPTSTFYVRAEGNAMKKTGIHSGDVIVVDRSLIPNHGAIVIVSINEEVIIRRLIKKENRIFLVSDNDRFTPIPVHDETDWMIWGVATHLIHRFRNLGDEVENEEQKEPMYEM